MKKLSYILAISFIVSGVAHAQMPAKVQACIGCHGQDGNSTSPIFPKLAGQHA